MTVKEPANEGNTTLLHVMYICMDVVFLPLECYGLVFMIGDGERAFVLEIFFATLSDIEKEKLLY